MSIINSDKPTKQTHTPNHYQLWVSKIPSHPKVKASFQMMLPDDEPLPGTHYIALEKEEEARATYYRIKAIYPDADIALIHLSEPFPFWFASQKADIDSIFDNSQLYELWTRDRNQKPLGMADAKPIAEVILKAPLADSERKIELDDLRKRCGKSDYAWGEFIADLESERHRIVDGKTNDPDQRLQLELKALLKEADPIKFIRKRKFLSQQYGISFHEIDYLLKHLDLSTNQPKPRCLSFADLLSRPQAGVDYLIPGMLPKGECVLLVAPPKAGKSLLAYDAAFAVATGEDNFLGETTAQGKVLIIQTDESTGSTTGRLVKRGFRQEDDENLLVMDNVTLAQQLDIEAALEEHHPNLLVADCLKSLTNGLGISENSAEFADIIYKFKQLLSRYNCAGILIHHTNKNQDALGVEKVRGSSAIAGAVWGVWELSHIPKPDPNNKKKLIIDPKDPTRILSISARDVEGQRLKIELDPENNHWLNLGEEGVDESEAANRKTHEQEILALLQQEAPKGLEGTEIRERLGLGRSVYQHLNRLLDKGQIGSRPSAVDKRRTVYFYPTPCDSTPPPPPLCVLNCDLSAETLTQTELQDRSQIDHKLITNGSQELQVDPPVSNSNADQTSVVEIDHNVTLKGEGGGIQCDSSSSNNDPIIGATVRYFGANASLKRKYGRRDLIALDVVANGFNSEYDSILCQLPNGETEHFTRSSLRVIYQPRL